VTSTLVFEGEGRVGEYVGGYDDWLRQRSAGKNGEPKRGGKTGRKHERPRKMSFKEEKELDELPEKIEALEEKKERLYKVLADPETYQQGGDKISEAKVEAEAVEEALSSAYRRWEELEEIRSALEGTGNN